MPRVPAPAIAALAVVSMLSVGCGGGDITEPGAGSGSPSPTAGDEAASPPPGLDDVIAEARSLVGEAAGVSEDDVELIEASEVTWPDGALGCPQPDQMYTQALVEGYRIVMEADGEEFYVHGAENQSPFICEDPQEPASADA
ncbi:MAG: hypothetical protein R3320_12520 [Nitriliruptorales bacterium]|nr:hypothetical protein [Nitriliruptorales bacterium]